MHEVFKFGLYDTQHVNCAQQVLQRCDVLVTRFIVIVCLVIKKSRKTSAKANACVLMAETDTHAPTQVMTHTSTPTLNLELVSLLALLPRF
jgi:hypothetical protein